MFDGHGEAAGAQHLGDLGRDHRRSVAAAAATDGDGEVPLSFLEKAGDENVEQLLELAQEVDRCLTADHELAHFRIRPPKRTKILDPVRVREESNVEDAALAALGVPVLRADLTVDGLRHDPERLATALKQLL